MKIFFNSQTIGKSAAKTYKYNNNISSKRQAYIENSKANFSFGMRPDTIFDFKIISESCIKKISKFVFIPISQNIDTKRNFFYKQYFDYKNDNAIREIIDTKKQNVIMKKEWFLLENHSMFLHSVYDNLKKCIDHYLYDVTNPDKPKLFLKANERYIAGSKNKSYIINLKENNKHYRVDDFAEKSFYDTLNTLSSINFVKAKDNTYFDFISLKSLKYLKY